MYHTAVKPYYILIMTLYDSDVLEIQNCLVEILSLNFSPL